jgi:hypothetical protein
MKSFLRLTLGLSAASFALAFAGCSDDEPVVAGSGAAAGHGGQAHSGAASGGASDEGPTCEVIGELCHEADTGSGPGHDCHELGHEGHAAACVAGFDDCIALCVPAEEGGGGGGAAGSGPAPDPHCAALGELCHPVDDTEGPLHECHEIGHVGNAANCAAEFDNCATLCLVAREEQEAGPEGTSGAAGAGGAGGVSSGGVSSGGAAGASR